MASEKFQKELLGLESNLYGFAYMLTSNSDDAKDLLQDTILKALENEDKYAIGTNLKAWVFTIMHNHFINNCHHKTIAKIVADQTKNQYLIDTTAEIASDNPEALLEASDIKLTIQTLPKEYRIPFKMHLAGFKYEEISEKLSLPIGTVKTRIFKARQKLQNSLSDYR